MPQADEFSIELPPDMFHALRESVEAGEYRSVGAALRDAVRIWLRDRKEHAERLAAIKARIDRSMDDPRPSLTEEEVDEHFRAFFSEQVKLRGDEAA